MTDDAANPNKPVEPGEPFASELRSLFQTGERELQAGNWTRAFEVFRRSYERMLAEQPPAARFHKGLPLHNMGLARLRQGDVEGGLTYTFLAFVEDALSRAVENPSSPDELARPAATNLIQFGLRSMLLSASHDIRELVAQGGAWRLPEAVLDRLGLEGPLRDAASRAVAGVIYGDTTHVARTFTYGAVAINDDDLRFFVRLAAGLLDRGFRVSVSHARGSSVARYEVGDLAMITRLIPASAIGWLELSGQSQSGTAAKVRLWFDDLKPASIEVEGQRPDVGVLREYLGGFLEERERGGWVGVGRSWPAYAAVSAALGTSMIGILGLALQRFGFAQDGRIAIVMATATLAIFGTRYLGVQGKLLPGTYVAGWGRFAWLRLNVWKAIVAATTIVVAALLAWILS